MKTHAQVPKRVVDSMAEHLKNMSATLFVMGFRVFGLRCWPSRLVRAQDTEVSVPDAISKMTKIQQELEPQYYKSPRQAGPRAVNLDVNS